MLTRVHVNRHTLARNRKTGNHEPAITIKTSRSNTYAHEVEINGPSRVVYRPDKPLACGAVLWVETTSEVIPLVREVKPAKRKAKT